MNTTTRPLADTIEVLTNAMVEGTKLGMDLLQGLASNPATVMVNRLLTNAGTQIRRSGKCSCDIPPACWLPRNLGEVVTPVCPGGTATLRIRVTNCTTAAREIRITPAGDDKVFQVKPPVMSVGRMERGTFIATATISPDAAFGQE